CRNLFVARHVRQTVLGREVYKGPPIRVEERLDDHCLHIRLTHCCKGASKLTGATDQYWFKSDAYTRSRKTQVLYERRAKRARGRGGCENCNTAEVWNEFAEPLYSFSSDLSIHCG